MPPCRPTAQPRAARRRSARRGLWFWLLVLGSAVFMSLEPSLFLVTVALGLSAVTLFWVLLLVRLLVGDALAYAVRHSRLRACGRRHFYGPLPGGSLRTSKSDRLLADMDLESEARNPKQTQSQTF